MNKLTTAALSAAGLAAGAALAFWVFGTSSGLAGCAANNPSTTEPTTMTSPPTPQPTPPNNTTTPSSEETIIKTDAEWKELLTDEQFYVTRKAGTERPFTGEYDKHFADGAYACVCCGEVLFTSEDKYNSGCGWPAFSETADDAPIKELSDTTHGMTRTEVRCEKCDAHLGHVFNDGPRPTGLRYCINSAAMEFIPADQTSE